MRSVLFALALVFLGSSAATAGVCSGMSTADCTLRYQPDLGITDADCDHDWGLNGTGSTTREQCLAVTAREREILRQYLTGTLPPIEQCPDQTEPGPNPNSPVATDPSLYHGRTRCITTPNGGTACIALPRLLPVEP